MGLEHSDQDCQNAMILDWQKSCQNDRFLIGFHQWFGWDRNTVGHLYGVSIYSWPPVWHFIFFPGARADAYLRFDNNAFKLIVIFVRSNSITYAS